MKRPPLSDFLYALPPGFSAFNATLVSMNLSPRSGDAGSNLLPTICGEDPIYYPQNDKSRVGLRGGQLGRAGTRTSGTPLISMDSVERPGTIWDATAARHARGMQTRPTDPRFWSRTT